MPTGKKKKSFWSVQLSIGARNQLLLIKIRLSTSKMLVVSFFLSGHVFVDSKTRKNGCTARVAFR